MTAQIVAVYSEAGGATKTTTAVALAVTAARAGLDVLLVDLDPRAAATRWLGVEPSKPGLDVSAIIGNADPDGWADDLAVPTDPDRWSPQLRAVPSARAASVSETGHADGQELRLRRALAGCTADLVLIDCPNRQGGALTQNALYAAQQVLYAAKLDTDGREGVEGAMQTVARHQRNMAAIGAANPAQAAGIVVGLVHDAVPPRIERHILTYFQDAYPQLLLQPLVPQRTIVREAREAADWFGNYTKGAVVAAAYAALAQQIVTQMKEPTP